MIALLVSLLLVAAPVTVRDTLAPVGDETDPHVAALSWAPAEFEAEVSSPGPGDADALVRFPSPRLMDTHTNTATLLWYQAQTEEPGAPAVVIVHSLHPAQPMAKMLARLLQQQGIHALVLQLPGYGLRRAPGRHPGVVALERAGQAVADVRRARDVAAALPGIGDVSLAGISLGGFAAATGAALDGAYDQVFLITTGAGLLDVLNHGSKDARLLRLYLGQLGYTDARLAGMLDPVDPVHVADRLDPATTWLFSARHDVTIPRANIDLLANTIGLAENHHIWMEANHYTTLFALPGIAQAITREVRAPSDP